MYSIRGLIAASDPLRGRPRPVTDARLRAELQVSTTEGVSMSGGPQERVRGSGLRWAVGAAAVLVVAVVVTVTVTALDDPPPPAGDEAYWADARSLEEAADVVVRAAVVGTSGDDPAGVDTRVDVVASVGTAPADQIVVAHPTAASQPGVDLTDGAEYVLVLDRVDDGTYVLVSVSQGVIPVSGGTVPADALVTDETVGRLGLARS